MAIEELKQEPMMAHLVATLDSGDSVGHYGRLVFAMVGRYFLEPDELCSYLQKDPEFNEDQAKSLLSIRCSRGTTIPPKREERILEWMRKQDFPVCPNADDPTQCNVYRNLDFPKRGLRAHRGLPPAAR